MTIHREGYTILFVLLIVLFALNWAVSYFFPGAVLAQQLVMGGSLIFYLIILQFFRNPIFTVEKNENNIIAPADGKVVVIEETDEPEFLKDRRKQISIFMSPFNVHVNRMPVGGTIKYFKYHQGKYLVAWHPKSSTENERTTVVAEMKNGTQVLFRQIAGSVARRIIAYVKEGDTVWQGRDMGFIKFGSRVDLFLPLDADILVSLEEKSIGNKTVIAKLKS